MPLPPKKYDEPSDYSGIDEKLLEWLEPNLRSCSPPVEIGSTWTTDAPFRETASAIDACRNLGLVAVVTPDMHRVHHSVVIRETNSNYGFAFPWWDRIFGTYKDQPIHGHNQMIIGLSQFRDINQQSILQLLLMPFVGKLGKIPINLH